MVRRNALLFTAALALVAGPARSQIASSQSGSTAGDRKPAVLSTTVTPITGNATMFNAGAGIANLDAGNLVSGSTWWQIEGAIVWVETYLAFLWTPAAGASVFEVPQSIYFNDNMQVPAEIADDGTVVGTNVFFNTLVSRPFQWTDTRGFEYLATPGSPWIGGATAVSADGRVVAGSLQTGVGGLPQATRWVNGVLEFIGPDGMRSNAYDTSNDGAVIVGEVGPDVNNLVATRWIDGFEVGLDPAPGQAWSTAREVSANGNVSLGWASVNDQEVLVRWKVDGTASVFTPPNGLSIRELNAVNPKGTALVGTLTDEVPFQENWVPFLWTRADGFTLIGELGRPDDYDRSQALGVSDDGRRVVGALQSSVISNGDPPSIAFLWTPAAGTQDIEDLLMAAGEPPLGLYHARTISGDGSRILATGVVRPTLHDTTSVLIEFAFGSPLK
jgi:uncharacterized membrane protein